MLNCWYPGSWNTWDHVTLTAISQSRCSSWEGQAGDRDYRWGVGQRVDMAGAVTGTTLGRSDSATVQVRRK